MNPDWKALLWDPRRLGDAIAALARECGLEARSEKLDPSNDEVESIARMLGLEAIATEISYADFERSIQEIGPAILRVPEEERERYLAVLGNSLVLTPELRKIRVDPAAVRSLLCGERESAAAGEAQEAVKRAGVPAARQARARESILKGRFSGLPIRGIWLLRLPPSASFWLQLRQARVPQSLSILTCAHAIQYLLWILAWWIVGSSVLTEPTDRTWLVAWGLLLAALIPFRVLITWLQGLIAIGAGVRLKRRLFFGALRMSPDSIRHQGAGQLLGRVIESEAVEALALSGGFLGAVAMIELIIAMFVLAGGAGGILQSALLLAWLALAGVLARQYFMRSRNWTDVRLAMTHDLVESLVGHRTRLAQLAPTDWHAGEDAALAGYLEASKKMDGSTAALLAIVPRGWLVVGLAGLAPAFVNGPSTGKMAIAVGGMLLAYRALRRLSAGAWQVAGAAVAWERVAVLYRSATRAEIPGVAGIRESGSSSVIEAQQLVYRYNDRADPILRGCDLQIRNGDRVVVEGPSGSGKSTLVSILAGLREPNAGRLLVDGHDLATLGTARWRSRIAAAPQFHENHVLTGTFAFNLFMGSRRLPGATDLAEAESLCQELGLGDLLARMPAGMLQMVGETGWQLSHGERSRVYIARALLQGAEVVVLDESFAALDPENLKRVLECVVRRARSLIVIAHR